MLVPLSAFVTPAASASTLPSRHPSPVGAHSVMITNCETCLRLADATSPAGHKRAEHHEDFGVTHTLSILFSTIDEANIERMPLPPHFHPLLS